MTSTTFLSFLFSLILLGHAVSADADPRQNLDTMVVRSIRQLEAKEYKEFLQTVVAPDELKAKSKEAGGIDALAKAFGENKAASLLAVLKAIQSTKPALDEDAKNATFTIPEGTASKAGTIKFTRIETIWYIVN